MARIARILRLIAASLGVVVVFVVAVAAGALLHLDLPVARRLASAQVQRALASSFAGSFTLERLDGLSARGLSGARVHVRDPSGATVIVADGVRARLSPVRLVRSLFAGGDLDVVIDEIEVASADVSLEADSSGALRLGKAFAPKMAPAAPKPASSGGRRVLVDLAHVTLEEAWIHGAKSAALPLEVDANLERVNGSVRVADAVTIAIDSMRVRARALPGNRDLDARLEGRVELPSATTPLVARASLVGSSNGEALDVRADVRRDAALDAHARIALNDALVVVEARGALAPSLGIDVRCDAGGVDLGAIDPTLPRSTLAASVSASLAGEGGALRGDASLSMWPGRVGDRAIPRLTARAKLQRDGERSPLRADAAVAIDEPGAPMTAALTVQSDGEATVVAAEVRALVAQLDRVAGLDPTLHGGASAVATATFRTSDQAIRAHVVADVKNIVRGDLRAGVGHVDASVDGHLSSFAARADLDVRAFSMRGQTADARVRASGVVTPGGTTTAIRDLRLAAMARGENVDVRAEVISFAPHDVRVREAVVRGLGAPMHLDAHLDARTTSISMQAPRIDLARVARLASFEDRIHGGVVAIDADVRLDDSGANGRLVAELRDGSFKQVPHVDLHVDGQLEGRRLWAHLQAKMEPIGRVAFDAVDLRLGEAGASTLEGWEDAIGTVSLDGEIDLARMAAALQLDPRTLRRVAGVVTLRGSAKRVLPEGAPSLNLFARTSGLVVTTDSFWTAGIDAAVDAHIAGSAGSTELAVRLSDRLGALVTADVKAELPYRLLHSKGGFAHALDSVPFAAAISVPRRSLAKLPPPVAALIPIEALDGDFEATVVMQGSAREPKVDLNARARRLRAGGPPIDADVDATYDGAVVDARIAMRTRKTEVLRGVARVTARLTDALDHRAMPWEASLHAEAERFPLAMLASLTDTEIAGHVSGAIVVEGLNADAHARAALRIEDLRVNQVAYTGGRVNIDAGGGTLRASARIDQPDGYAEVVAGVGIDWRGRAAPALVDSAPLHATLRARAFRAAVLLPFMESVFSVLDGRIDADAQLDFGANGGDPRLVGSVSFHDGHLELQTAGMDIRDARAKATFAQGGLVKIDDVFAHVDAGELSGSGTLQLRGAKLAGAKASFSIPRTRPIPVDVEGSQIGDVYGSVDASVAPSADGAMNVDINVPTLHVRMPLAAAKHSVQGLAPQKDIRVGVRGASGDLVPLPLAPTKAPAKASDTNGASANANATTAKKGPLKVAVHLRDVEITRGTGMRVYLEGDPVIQSNGVTHVSGQIRLTRGFLDVQGRRFEIERGTVTFVGDDPSNPEIYLTAGWKAPEGTMVHAEFVGPVRTGKVTLRSEPGRPQNEILALILFGTADGTSTGGSASGTAIGAGAAAGSFATEGLSQALDDLTGLHVSTKVDTSGPNPRPEVEVAIARDITLQLAFVLGTPPPGTNPDTALATLDWRFLGHWSVAATFGDQGTSIFDLVWQLRY